MFQVKPPIGVDDQPHLGVSVLEVTHRREVPESGPSQEEVTLAILIRLGQIQNQLETLAVETENVRMLVQYLRDEAERRTWTARWARLKALCRRWWLRLRGYEDGT